MGRDRSGLLMGRYRFCVRLKRVNWVMDADIRGFFDQMSHEWTMKFVQHRVADSRIVRPKLLEALRDKPQHGLHR